MALPTNYDTKGATPQKPILGQGPYNRDVYGGSATIKSYIPPNTLPKVGGLLPPAVANQVASGGLKTPTTPTSGVMNQTSQQPSTPLFSASLTQTPSISQNQNSTPSSPVNTNAFSENIQNLTNYGSGKESPGVTKARQDLADFEKEAANQTREINTGRTWTSRALGEQHQADIQNAATRSALQQAVGNSITSQGQQIGAAGTGGGLAQPVGQFGMLTNPQTGQPLNTGVFQSAISQAQQLVNNGTPVNDPSVQALLSPFGFVGPLAFNQAMQMQGGQGGGWNPAAQSEIASTNIGIASGLQPQGVALSQGLQNLAKLQPIVNDFLTRSGINPTDAKMYNSQINAAIGSLGNPGAKAQWDAYASEIKGIASQIIGAKNAAGTPTSTDELVAANDPSLLSASQLNTLMNTWDSLGNAQLGTIQSTIGKSLNSGGSPYSGDVAGNTPTSLPISPPANVKTTPGASQNSNPVTNFMQGVALNTVSTIWKGITDFSGEILGILGGKLLGI